MPPPPDEIRPSNGVDANAGAAALLESEARFHAIFESTRDGILIVRPDGQVVELNPAACAMYGYEHDEVIGRALADLIDADSGFLFAHLPGRLEDGKDTVVQTTGCRRDGSRFRAEVQVSSITLGGEQHVLSVVRDVSDRVPTLGLLEQRVQERTRQLSMLLQVSREVASTLQLEPLLAQVLDLLAEVIVYDAAAIFSVQEDEQLRLLDYRGPRSRANLPREWDLSQVEHIRMVLDSRRPLTIPDVGAETLRAQAWQRTWGAGMAGLAENSASWLGVPLVVQNRLIGTLTLEHHEIGHFTPLDAKLALTFANHVAVAMENARLYEASQRLGMLEERQRIARELHDSVSQALYGIGLGARTALGMLDPVAVGIQDPACPYGTAEVLEPLEYVLSLAESGLSDMRSLLLELRPDALEREGLIASLQNRLTALRRRQHLQVVDDLPEEPDLPGATKEALYRVTQEALNNITRHANADQVGVSLLRDGAAWVLTIEDDGDGFDAQRRFPGHFGLQSMRERIERIGGVFDVTSAPGRGTSIRVRVPKQPAED